MAKEIKFNTDARNLLKKVLISWLTQLKLHSVLRDVTLSLRKSSVLLRLPKMVLQLPKEIELEDKFREHRCTACEECSFQDR
jgi:hypothetical protein